MSRPLVLKLLYHWWAVITGWPWWEGGIGVWDGSGFGGKLWGGSGISGMLVVGVALVRRQGGSYSWMDVALVGSYYRVTWSEWTCVLLMSVCAPGCVYWIISVPSVSLTGDQLINNQQFAQFLSGEDEVALQYLTSLTVEEYEDSKSGYKIAFVSSWQEKWANV